MRRCYYAPNHDRTTEAFATRSASILIAQFVLRKAAGIGMSNGTLVRNRARRPTIRASWAARLALMTCSTLLALATVELALRIQFATTQRSGLEALSRETRFVQPRREVRLGDLVRPSLHPGVIYELIPGASTTFKDKSLRINEMGFRGPTHSLEKPENTVRILGVGDSVMFGWGVEQHETYLALLATRLNARHPHVNWQVINTGVPGYNTAMEAAVLRSRGLAYEPDLVIVGYVPNDLDLPNFLLDARSPWSCSESFLANFIARDVGPNRLVLGKKGRHHVLFNAESDLELVPKEYRYMVGEAGFRAALSEMCDLRKQHGFDLLVFSYVGKSAHHQRINQIAEQLEAPFLSADENTRRYLKERGIRKWPGSELVLSDEDPHPSAIWHELLANAILDQMEGSGLVDRISSRDARQMR